VDFEVCIFTGYFFGLAFLYGFFGGFERRRNWNWTQGISPKHGISLTLEIFFGVKWGGE